MAEMKVTKVRGIRDLRKSWRTKRAMDQGEVALSVTCQGQWVQSILVHAVSLMSYYRCLGKIAHSSLGSCGEGRETKVTRVRFAMEVAVHSPRRQDFCAKSPGSAPPEGLPKRWT